MWKKKSAAQQKKKPARRSSRGSDGSTGSAADTLESVAHFDRVGSKSSLHSSLRLSTKYAFDLPYEEPLAPGEDSEDEEVAPKIGCLPFSLFSWTKDERRSRASGNMSPKEIKRQKSNSDALNAQEVLLQHNLVNALAKFSPANVHLELASHEQAYANMKKGAIPRLTEPSVRVLRGCLLFVDISGFTRLSTRLGIEALQRHMNEIYTRAVEIICKHNGDVLKYAGDAMLILWVAQEQSQLPKAVAMAAHCALALQTHPGATHHVNEEGVDVLLTMHNTIGCGETVVYRVGDSERWEFIVAGEPLEQIRIAEPYAKSGETSLSPEAAAQLPLETEPFATEDCPGEDGVRLLKRKTSLSSQEQQAGAKFLLRRRNSTNNYRQPRSSSMSSIGDRQSSENASTEHILSLQYKGRTSMKLRDKSSLSVLRSFAVAPVLQTLASLCHEGALTSRRRSLRTIDSHLAEQRTVTTVFTNIVGLSEAFNAAELGKVQDCFSTIVLCAAARGALLRQFIVDDKGCVAIVCFGVRSSSFEDDERRAVLYAHSLVRALKQQSIYAYCGITVGTAFCGLVGAPWRCEYAVMGPSVNLAARLMASASKQAKTDKNSTSVLVAHAVYRALEETPLPSLAFDVREPIVAKGFAEPVEVYALRDVEAGEASNMNAFMSRGALAPLTGREPVLESIHRVILEQRPAKPLRLVFVDGEAGLGKTKTLSELATRYGALYECVEASADSILGMWYSIVCALTDATSVSTETDETNNGMPHLRRSGGGFLQTSPNKKNTGKVTIAKKIDGSQSPTHWRKKFSTSPTTETSQRSLADLEQPEGRRGSFFTAKSPKAKLLSSHAQNSLAKMAASCDPANPEWQALSVSLKNEVLANVLTALLERASMEVVLFIDNAQCFDESSWELLDILSKQAQSPRCVVVLASRMKKNRSGFENELRRESTCCIELGPLVPASACELICHGLDIYPASRVEVSRVTRVLEACSGHPVLLLSLCDGIEKRLAKAGADAANKAAAAEALKEAEEGRESASIISMTLEREGSRRRNSSTASSRKQRRGSCSDDDDEIMSSETASNVAATLSKSSALAKNVASMLPCMRAKVCKQGETLLFQGERADCIYVVESGKLDVLQDGVNVNTTGAGYIIGDVVGILRNTGVKTRFSTSIVGNAQVSKLWVLDRADMVASVRPLSTDDQKIAALYDLADAGTDTINKRVWLPSSLAGVITNTLDNLSLQATTLVKLASAFGVVFHQMALEASYRGKLKLRMDETLAELVNAGLVKRDTQQRLTVFQHQNSRKSNKDTNGGTAPGIFRFAALSASEVIYSIVLVEQRREYHVAIAEFFEEMLNACYPAVPLQTIKKQEPESPVIDKGAASRKAYQRKMSTESSSTSTLSSGGSTRSRISEDDNKAVEEEELPVVKPVPSRSSPAAGAWSSSQVRENISIDYQAVVAAWHLAKTDLHSYIASHYARACVGPAASMSQQALAKALEFGQLAAQNKVRLGMYREAEEHYRLAINVALAPRDSVRLIVGLSELYARFDLEPLPRSDSERAPLGGGSMALLHYFLNVFDIQIADIKTSSAKQLQELSRTDIRLVSTALRNLGWCHVKAGLDSPSSFELAQTCFATSVAYLRHLGDVPLAVAEAQNGFGVFYQECALTRKRKITTAVPAALPLPPPTEKKSKLKSANSQAALTPVTPSDSLSELSPETFWVLAEDKLAQAYALADEFSNEGLELAQASVSLGALSIECGRTEAARSFYNRALELYLKHLGEENPRTAHAYLGLARVVRLSGTKLVSAQTSESSESMRQAGLLMLYEARELLRKAVKARQQLGQRHIQYRNAAMELSKLEDQIAALSVKPVETPPPISPTSPTFLAAAALTGADGPKSPMSFLKRRISQSNKDTTAAVETP